MASGMENIKVLREDEQILVVLKPANVVVNRAESVRDKTLQDWVEDTYKEIGKVSSDGGGVNDVFIKRSGIAHRLDKDTSGVMIICKDPESLSLVMNQFKERSISKTYTALVHGKLTPREGSWMLPVKRSLTNRQRFGVFVEGKMAKTDYVVEGYYRVKDAIGEGNVYSQGLTLLTLKPKTGRTHQLRVHLKHMKHPIVADRLYLGKRRLKSDLSWCDRHFLHASGISFIHPSDGKLLTVQAPLSEDLVRALSSIEENI